VVSKRPEAVKDQLQTCWQVNILLAVNAYQEIAALGELYLFKN
jgi:hypothetical protein